MSDKEFTLNDFQSYQMFKTLPNKNYMVITVESLVLKRNFTLVYLFPEPL